MTAQHIHAQLIAAYRELACAEAEHEIATGKLKTAQETVYRLRRQWEAERMKPIETEGAQS